MTYKQNKWSRLKDKKGNDLFIFIQLQEALDLNSAFKILSETGVSSGVRRIEAITGQQAVHYLNTLAQESLEARAKAGVTVPWDQLALPSWIERSQEQIRSLEKEIQKLKGGAVDVADLVKSAKEFKSAVASGSAGGGSVKSVFAPLEVDDRKVLSDISDRLRDKLSSGSVTMTIGQTVGGSSPAILSVSKDIQAAVPAGQLLGAFLKEFGGKGGGRPDFAQGSLPGDRNVKLWEEKWESILKIFLDKK